MVLFSKTKKRQQKKGFKQLKLFFKDYKMVTLKPHGPPMQVFTLG